MQKFSAPKHLNGSVYVTIWKENGLQTAIHADFKKTSAF